jgi:hypothetical protein
MTWGVKNRKVAHRVMDKELARGSSNNLYN